MCCLFGILDHGGVLTQKQRNRLLAVLSTACEERGTDATGIAYNSGGKLQIYKRPQPAHRLFLHTPPDARLIMGHTRMTTQGSEKRNWNNHPFPGNAGGVQFALAHNGVLYNDLRLRQDQKLPATHIETDSYVAVQLIEKRAALNEDSLRYMAEQVEGSFTFTVLDGKNNFYFIKGDNPLCIYRYPKSGLYVYASTEAILKTALAKIRFPLGQPVRIWLDEGEILKIDAAGAESRSEFRSPYLLWNRYSFYPGRVAPPPDGGYLDDLRSVAAYYGYAPEDVDQMLAEGFTTDEIEEMLYTGGYDVPLGYTSMAW